MYSRESKRSSIIDQFVEEPIMYYPVEDYDGIKYRQFFLPQEPAGYGRDEILEKEIYEFLDYWCDYPKEFKILDVAYIKLTWIADLLSVVPYRRALGEWGTGKSRWAECILALSQCGFKQGATATAPGIFRKADLYRGTQGFDENEYSGNSSISEAIHLVLNCSYSRATGAVTRMEKSGGDFIPKQCICYGPKIIAARKGFVDVATESRCITHRSFKSKKVPLDTRQRLLQNRSRSQEQAIVLETLPC